MNLGLFTFIILSFVSFTSADARTLKIAMQEGFDKLQSVQEVRDFVQESLRDEGLIVSFLPLPFARSSTLVDKGELDGELMRAGNIVHDFANIIVVPKPLVFVEYSVIYKASKKFDEKNLHKYKGLVLLNSATTRDELERRKLKVENVARIEQGLQMVTSERADYIIIADPVIDSFKLLDPKNFEGLKAADSKFQKIPLFLCLNKKHKDLLPQIERGLSKGLRKYSKKYKILPSVINPNL